MRFRRTSFVSIASFVPQCSQHHRHLYLLIWGGYWSHLKLGLIRTDLSPLERKAHFGTIPSTYSPALLSSDVQLDVLSPRADRRRASPEWGPGETHKASGRFLPATEQVERVPGPCHYRLLGAVGFADESIFAGKLVETGILWQSYGLIYRPVQGHSFFSLLPKTKWSSKDENKLWHTFA